MTHIVLNRPHTHAGKPCKAGERLDVDGCTADWLIANGIARHDRQPVALSPEGNDAPTEFKPTHRKESKS